MAVNAGWRKRHTVSGVKGILSIPSRRLPADQPMDAGEILSVFAAARRLRADAHTGAISEALHGKNVALLVKAPGQESAALHRAAHDLGARVAEVLFVEPDASPQHNIGALGRILGRMYDAIDCGSLATPTVERIELEAGVPVYAGLGLDDHPARMLGDLLTLYEHGALPKPQATILFVGDPHTRRSRAFLTAARAIGFELKLNESSANPVATEMFAVDATHTRHWSLYMASKPIDEARRSENHRCVMQTVLLDTIVRA